MLEGSLYCRLQTKWTRKWSFVVAVRNDLFSFHCSLYVKNVSCKHQGEKDVTQHIHTMTHQKNAKGAKGVAIFSFSRSDGDSMRLKVLTNAVVGLADSVCVQ